MNDNKEFKPYISPDQIMPEITAASVIMGIILAVVFGGANAYLGLRVGMTVSASIPAAVLAMGVIRVILRKNSILESNIVQTMGSAGESLAAGAIFTIPALFLWGREGMGEMPGIGEITLIALLGGLLGVFFMVPLRNALIVKEHNNLPYPEGTACGEVLLAGENKGANAGSVFKGMGFAALVKFIIDGLKVIPGEIAIRFRKYGGEIGTQIYPAVFSVGYICGPRIASYMFAGGVLSWMVLIPIFVLLGQNMVLSPGTETIGKIYMENGAAGIWSSYIRYIGAGALAAGGIISLIKSLPLIIDTFKDSMKELKGSSSQPDKRTARDINIKVVIGAIGILTLLVWWLPVIPVGFTGAVIIVVFGFFFATVSSRMVGLVGSSNNPVSGMAIATLLITTLILRGTGETGVKGMQAAIAIGSIICIIAAISGDTSQDLKTGYLLGATPRKQQICEIVGVTASALAIGGTLYLLDRAWGFGSKELGAPQATLMKIIVEGVMENRLPWTLVILGGVTALIVEILGIPVLPFAIGVYLPVHLNACIMAGGVVRFILEKRRKSKNGLVNEGVLFCSGMIAGEGLVGIILAILTILGLDKMIDISGIVSLGPVTGALGSLALFGIVIGVLIKNGGKKRSER